MTTDPRKKVGGILGALILTLMFVSEPNALASIPTGAGEYQVKVGGVREMSATQQVFEQTGCAASIAGDTNINGLDAVIVDVSSISSKPSATARLTWTISVGSPQAAIELFTSSCVAVGSKTAAGASTIGLPNTTKWLVFVPQASAGITVMLSDIS